MKNENYGVACGARELMDTVELYNDGSESPPSRSKSKTALRKLSIRKYDSCSESHSEEDECLMHKCLATL